MCKKSICLVPIVLVLGLFGDASAELIAHWRLDADASDVVGGHDAVGKDGADPDAHGQQRGDRAGLHLEERVGKYDVLPPDASRLQTHQPRAVELRDRRRRRVVGGPQEVNVRASGERGTANAQGDHK